MSNLKVNSINDASGGSNAVLYGVAAPTNSMGFRNRIINGDMRIDQRNAGAAVTINSSTATYTLDRFVAVGQATDGVFTVQQVSDAPAGFINSLKVTTTTADASIGASQDYSVRHYIEGLNVADLGWGTASAQSVTFSFKAKSSITGTFSGSITNSAQDRSYVFTYTINSANTWEDKTVTIAGDTSGTWLTTNGRGIHINWMIGAGSTFFGTPNTWAAGFARAASGQVNVIGTLSATWQITGVQLEAGSVASPFERRDYGRELAMCQRYAVRIDAASDTYTRYGIGECVLTTQADIFIPMPVEMRTKPTSLTTTGTASNYAMYAANSIRTCTTVPIIQSASQPKMAVINASVASGLTAGGSAQFISNNNTASYLVFSAEL
jgi:hypothetical protein